MKIRATTILSVRHRGYVALGGDGQFLIDPSSPPTEATQVRRVAEGHVLCGFAGSGIDASDLLQRFDRKLMDYHHDLRRAASELAREWTSDRVLRRLQAFFVAADASHTLLISGTGDVIQPQDGIVGIGSGGNLAVAAARALTRHSPLAAAEIVRHSLQIASEIDIYTNHLVVVEQLACHP